ncbi:unnamed protein product [Durusdinium trenchii]|uniref:VDE lipocalin domain-containing protein n=1 Tax=Durusdinium trenchii TaxID=1381693 RepID=A0ABP0HV03_9DINO
MDLKTACPVLAEHRASPRAGPKSWQGGRLGSPGRPGKIGRVTCATLAIFTAPIWYPKRLRQRRRVWELKASARPVDVLLVVGEGACPWGEGGTETMAKALGLKGSVPWPLAIQHLAGKLRQAVPGLNVQVSTEQEAEHAAEQGRHQIKLVALINVTSTTRNWSQGGLSSTLVLSSTLGRSKLWARSGGDGDAEKVLSRCGELWSRDTAEDCFYALLFAIHFSVKPVPLVEQEPQIISLEKIWRLCTRCLNEAMQAGLDGEARACLACQSGCDVRDQTQMYRCTVSHESDALARLVRCFERRGIFDCEAEIPEVPFEPMATFKGKRLTQETAWSIMEGHWDFNPESCSWRPVLGQNPAYDYFPCQYNSWYRDPKGNRGWYDPVFRVITLDGRAVWRKRHYRVLPGKQPGSFNLSTEDNGISLKEFWRIVDADDKLTWAVFHYAGAAKSVGQSYTGSLLVTKDGTLGPSSDSLPAERIRQAFEKAGVAAFELYGIQQDTGDADVESAPLTRFGGLPRYRDMNRPTL